MKNAFAETAHTAAFVMLLAFCYSYSAHATVESVTTAVDRNPVMLDESFTLTVVANGDVDREAFEPSALLSDFVVGQTSVSSQTRMINFETSRSTTWSVILFPRQVGTFTIPPITIDGQSSQPISLQVIPVSTSATGEMRDIFVDTALEHDEVYVHQQVRYTVKLYLAKDIERGSLQAPTLEQAEIQQIGNDSEYSEVVNGKRYRVIERTFIIIPQKSGDYTINGPMFQGEVYTDNRQSFGFFNRTQTVNRVGQAQQLTVLPIPAEVNGTFLPSEFVDISEEWSSDLSEWRVGEPITRTITVTAVGLTESLLPDINDRYPPDIKTYPDQANTASAENQQSLVAQRIESVALIPSKPGNFVLLPVEVEWFNVLTEQREFAKLPARTIRVLPAQNSTPDMTAPPAAFAPPQQQQTPDNLVTPPALTTVPLPANQPVFEWRMSNGWMWTTLLALIACVVVLIRRSAVSPSVPMRQSSTVDANEAQLWTELQRALKQANIDAVTAHLIQWLGALTNNSSQDLAWLIERVDDHQLKQFVEQMIASRYSRTAQQWKPAALIAALQRVRREVLGQQKNNALKGLYPAVN
ncbi:BatD family protein [Alteromonas sp. ASW11-36]|uniref:BatD family protein n=2 Tax=Alteromonas arenosi TaxID=3055817 RepID=A0ABT7SWQ5_9ALTE|nr:BatD family protein [Alteromonas sp. ASW11-36]